MTDMELLEVPIEQIKCRAATPSDDLTNSLIERGQRDPINVRPINDGQYCYEIASGNRRFLSLLEQSARTAWVCVIEATDIEFALDALTLNSGTPNFLDEAEQIIYLIDDQGIEVEAIAKSSGLSLGTVYGRIRLARKLLPEFKELLRSGAIRYTATLELVKLPLSRQKQFYNRLLAELNEGKRTKINIKDCAWEWRAYQQEGRMTLDDNNPVERFQNGSYTSRSSSVDLASNPLYGQLLGLLGQLKAHEWAARTAKCDKEFVKGLIEQFDKLNVKENE